MTQAERERAEKAARAHAAAKAYAESCDTESHDQYIEKYGDFLAGYEQAMKDASAIRAAAEELRDAACTAVNWKLLLESKVGDAPWISTGDANDVELAVMKLNDTLK